MNWFVGVCMYAHVDSVKCEIFFWAMFVWEERNKVYDEWESLGWLKLYANQSH